jgi:hypothetical protein
VTVPLPAPILLKVSVTGCRANTAVRLVAAVMATVQAPTPEQLPPFQPVKMEPAAGVAVSVTLLPLGKLLEQVAPQVIPAGELVTVPVPAPVMLKVKVTGCRAKVAVTVVATAMVTAHVAVPEQPPPLQAVKVEPAAGVAVSVTVLPLGKLPEHVAPQLIPAGELVTVPLPAPVMLKVRVTGCRPKVAVTVVAAVTVTAHVPVPEQLPPLQPVKDDPASGLAVRVTVVPLG